MFHTIAQAGFELIEILWLSFLSRKNINVSYYICFRAGRFGKVGVDGVGTSSWRQWRKEVWIGIGQGQTRSGRKSGL